MRNTIRKITQKARSFFSRKYTTSPLMVGIVILGIFALARPSYAGLGDDIVRSMGYMLQAMVSFVGQMLLELVKALIWVAQYNGFVNSVPVMTGWVIVRDVTNMFFILVLLLIAFGTILGSDTYSYRNKNLSRFLIIAIVVNFSRTIAGLLIDFSQVVMLTFVNGFAAAAGGNFVDAFRLGELMQVSPKSSDVDATAIVVSFLLAMTFLTISLFLILAMLGVLVVRIVYLWLLVIISPLAFFLRGVPGGAAQGYYAEWWKMFTQQVIVGPVLAFFLWLSLVSVSAGEKALMDGFPEPTASGEAVNAAMSEAFKAQSIQQFIIAFGLMAGGLAMAQRLSPKGAALGSKARGLAVKGVKKGAGMMYKRSGMKTVMDQRRAEKEEKYKERGMKIRGGYNTLASGGKNRIAAMLGSRSAKQRIYDRKMQNINKQISDAGGDTKKVAELTKRKQDLRMRHDADMTKERSVLGKVTGRVGDAVAKSAAKDRGLARKAGSQVGGKESAAISALSDQELRADFDHGGLSGGEARAAALEMGKRGFLRDNESRSKAREALSGADQGAQNALEKSIADQNFLAAANISDKDKRARLDAGALDVKKLSVADMETHGEEIANSAMGWKYVKDANPAQKKGITKALSSLPEEQKTPAVREALLQTQTKGGLKTSFNLGANGAFATPELKSQFTDMLKKPGVTDKLIKVEQGDLRTKEGSLTEAGVSVGEAVAQNPRIVNSLASEASKNPTPQNTAAFQEVLSTALSASQAEQKKAPGEQNAALAALESTLRKSRSLGSQITNLEEQGKIDGRARKGSGDVGSSQESKVIFEKTAGGGAREAQNIEISVGDIKAELKINPETAKLNDIKSKLAELERKGGERNEQLFKKLKKFYENRQKGEGGGKKA